MTGTTTASNSKQTAVNRSPASGIDFSCQGKELRAFFDLQTHPVTFDIGNFLVMAEAARVRAGCSHIRIYVLPGLMEGFRNTKDGHSADHSRHRVSSIVLPAMRFLPSCAGVSVLTDRASALDLIPDDPELVYPENYRLDRPNHGYLYDQLNALADQGTDLQPLTATDENHRHLRGWLERHGLQHDKLVTITLREATYQTDRNSNLDAWGKFCAFLKSEGYQPIVMRDFDVMYEPAPQELEEYPFCDVANWDLGLRVALYEHAKLSFFVNNGPLVMCFFNRNVSFLVAKWITETIRVTSTAFRIRNNDPIGRDYKFLNDRQHIVWDNDDFSVLVESYRKFFGSVAEEAEGG